MSVNHLKIKATKLNCVTKNVRDAVNTLTYSCLPTVSCFKTNPKLEMPLKYWCIITEQGKVTPAALNRRASLFMAGVAG